MLCRYFVVWFRLNKSNNKITAGLQAILQRESQNS